MCPGWIYCPHKPHPFGNEYYSVLWQVQYFVLFGTGGGKDCPWQLPTEFDDLGGKTVGLLLRMLKSYVTMGKYVVHDSGFCVLKGLVELRKRGMFACTTLIKKRRYC
jgi:hypothetical protein